MEKIRILHCLIGSMNVGGIETVLMEVYRNIDKKKYSFDFVVHDKKENVYEKEINMHGGKLYRMDFFSKHPIRFLRQFNKLLVEHPEYKIIHIHTTYSIMLPYALLGKLKGRKIIIHSHNAYSSPKRAVVHKILKNYFNSLADYRVACSDLAAQWMFPEKNMNDVFYWYNAFELSRFEFDKEIRESIRKKYGANNKFVIGNVGRLSYQKNQGLLIDIFLEVQKKYDNAILWIIGDGEDRKKLEKRVIDLHIQEKVIFMGNQKNIEKYLYAMDVYVCTSRYEGLGVSLVEAQTSGLPVVTKQQRISRMTKIVDNYIAIDEKASISKWIEEIMKYQDYDKDRKESYKLVSSSKFNIEVWIKYVELFYQKVAKD